MRKPEQRLWDNEVRPALQAVPGLSFDRLEPGRGGASGVPDVVYSYGGTGFLELKVSNRKTGISLKGWRKDQRIWTLKHMQQGATVWLIVRVPHGTYLIDPWPVIHAEEVNEPVARWPERIKELLYVSS